MSEICQILLLFAFLLFYFVVVICICKKPKVVKKNDQYDFNVLVKNKNDGSDFVKTIEVLQKSEDGFSDVCYKGWK